MSDDRYYRCGACWNLFPLTEPGQSVIDLLIERRFEINDANRFWSLSSETTDWCPGCVERLKRGIPIEKGATA
jgi:hypothetical protein